MSASPPRWTACCGSTKGIWTRPQPSPSFPDGEGRALDKTESGDEERRRSFSARMGIAALNLLGPGLGLLRLERPRQALFWWLLSVLPFLLVILFWALSPVLTFRPLMACAAIVAAAS